MFYTDTTILLRYYASKKQCVSLRRDVTELHCHVEKLNSLLTTVREPLQQVDGSVPTVDLNTVKTDAPASSSRENLLVSLIVESSAVAMS